MSMIAFVLAGQLAIQAPMPEGFVEAYRAAQGGQTIEERIPAGETLERWSRMITLQNMAAPISPRTILDGVAAGFAAQCPGSPPAEISEREIAGRAEAHARITCARNAKTGKPEVMFGRAIAGDGSLHVAQYAFRSIPSDVEARAAISYLATAQLCGAAGCPTE